MSRIAQTETLPIHRYQTTASITNPMKRANMIIYDFMGHMTSTVGPEELHAYAELLGLKREWYQTPGYGEAHAHYDLTTPRMRAKAGRMGATLVDPLKLVEMAWWAKNSRIEKQGGGQHPS